MTFRQCLDNIPCPLGSTNIILKQSECEIDPIHAISGHYFDNLNAVFMKLYMHILHSTIVMERVTLVEQYI